MEEEEEEEVEEGAEEKTATLCCLVLCVCLSVAVWSPLFLVETAKIDFKFLYREDADLQ